jgi:hypothetical protein
MMRDMGVNVKSLYGKPNVAETDQISRMAGVNQRGPLIGKVRPKLSYLPLLTSPEVRHLPRGCPQVVGDGIASQLSPTQCWVKMGGGGGRTGREELWAAPGWGAEGHSFGWKDSSHQ